MYIIWHCSKCTICCILCKHTQQSAWLAETGFWCCSDSLHYMHPVGGAAQPCEIIVILNAQRYTHVKWIHEVEWAGVSNCQSIFPFKKILKNPSREYKVVLYFLSALVISYPYRTISVWVWDNGWDWSHVHPRYVNTGTGILHIPVQQTTSKTHVQGTAYIEIFTVDKCLCPHWWN